MHVLHGADRGCHAVIVQTQPTTHSLRLGLLMRFGDPLLEQRFLRFYESFYRRYAQASLLLGMVLILGDWLVDRLAFPLVSANSYRITLCLPILVAGLMVSFTQRGREQWQALMATIIVLVGCSLYWILAKIGMQQGSGLASWVGILNYTFFELYCFVILGIGFRYALPTGLVLFLGFEVAILTDLVKELPQSEYWTYHAFTVFLMAAMIGWWREFLLRKEFVAVAELEIATRVAQTQTVFLTGHDALTGLHNLAGFTDVLQREVASAGDQRLQLALLLIDIEPLRRNRGAFNQQLADEMLLTLVERLRQAAHGMEPAPVYARTTSFELAVMFRHVHETSAVAEAAERLLLALRQPLQIYGQSIYLQSTGGLAFYPKDGATLEGTLQAARVALSMHTDEERFLRFYDSEHDRALAQHLQLENDLRNALATGQFSVVYQPVLRVADLVPLGFEALLRWEHPVRGAISPVEFMPMIEELGLVHEIGDWILNKACGQAAQWQRDGKMVHEMAVNVSGLQLLDLDFAQKVSRALALSGLQPQYLVLELTESVLVHNNDTAMAQLHALKRLGLRLALDDFGTGFSSMSSITRFPFDIIKLDRSYVQTASTQPAAEAIVDAILAMASRLGMDTVAEGIETEEQLQYVTHRHCVKAQGYWFSKPLSAGEMSLFLFDAA